MLPEGFPFHQFNTCTLHDPWGPEKYKFKKLYFIKKYRRRRRRVKTSKPRNFSLQLCALCQNIVLLSQSEQVLKVVQKLVYRNTIFWETRNSRNSNFRFSQFTQKTWLWTCTCRNIFFSPNNILCVPRVFLPIEIENIYIIKAFWLIVLIEQNLVFREVFFASKQVSIWHESDSCPQKYLIIIIH